MNLSSKTLEELTPYSWWINQVLRQQNGDHLRLLCRFDKTLLELEKDNEKLEVLKEKARRFRREGCRIFDKCSDISVRNLSQKESEQRRQVWDFFCEIRSLEFLMEKGYKNIKILEEGPEKQPEFIAFRERRYFCIEVKNINVPREEEIALTGANFVGGSVETNYKLSLKKKVEEKFEQADAKFERYMDDGYKTMLILFFSNSISGGLVDGFQTMLGSLVDLEGIKERYPHVQHCEELELLS